MEVALKTPADMFTADVIGNQSCVLAMFAFPKTPTDFHSSKNCFAMAVLAMEVVPQYVWKSAILSNYKKQDRTMSLW